MRARRILIVDDDRGARELIAGVLDQFGYETFAVETGEEALEAMRAEHPALVILDVLLPGISGYEVCRHVKEEFREAVPVVFVSGTRVESLDRVAGLLVGGDDYVVKPFDPGELVARVRRLLRAPGGEPPPASRLTRREVEVLSLLADGLSQSAIGDELYISPKTVAKHVEHILAKLDVRSRTHAVALALRDGLIDADRPLHAERPHDADD